MAHVITVNLKQDQDFRFAIDFAEGIPVLYGDETPPLGGGSGPNPAQLLAAAVGNCMADSLLFAIRKFKQNPEPIRAAAVTEEAMDADPTGLHEHYRRRFRAAKRIRHAGGAYRAAAAFT